jgi:hypothetical protein
MKKSLKQLTKSMSFVINEPSDSMNDGAKGAFFPKVSPGSPKLISIILSIIYL